LCARGKGEDYKKVKSAYEPSGGLPSHNPNPELRVRELIWDPGRVK